MTVIRIPGISDKEVLPAPDGFAHAGVEVVGRRVGEAQFQLGMVADLNGAERGANTAFQIIAAGECAVLEARAWERGARFDGRVEAGFDHENVIVAGIAVNMPGLALDDVAHRIVGNAPAQAAHGFSAAHDGLVEHQRHRIVKFGGRRTDVLR